MKNFSFHVWRRFRMCSLIWLIWYFNIFLQIQIQVPTQHTQQPGNSFIDNNIGIDDLSASFRTIYKNMFETNPAGPSDFSATKKKTTTMNLKQKFLDEGFKKNSWFYWFTLVKKKGGIRYCLAEDFLKIIIFFLTLLKNFLLYHSYLFTCSCNLLEYCL